MVDVSFTFYSRGCFEFATLNVSFITKNKSDELVKSQVDKSVE